FNRPLTSEIYTLSLHDALPILDAELEFVGVGRAGKSFVESDELLGIKIEERLIERLHAVLAGASGDGVMNQARFVRVDDAIANEIGRAHVLTPVTFRSRMPSSA